MHSLLYNYMNELLFKFSSDSFCTVRAHITALVRGKTDAGNHNHTGVCSQLGFGDDTGDGDTSGTVKDAMRSLGAQPISYSLTARLEGDIFDPSRHTSGTEVKAITYSNMQIHETPDRTDLYVIVDI